MAHPPRGARTATLAPAPARGRAKARARPCTTPPNTNQTEFSVGDDRFVEEPKAKRIKKSHPSRLTKRLQVAQADRSFTKIINQDLSPIMELMRAPISTENGNDMGIRDEPTPPEDPVLTAMLHSLELIRRPPRVSKALTSPVMGSLISPLRAPNSLVMGSLITPRRAPDGSLALTSSASIDHPMNSTTLSTPGQLQAMANNSMSSTSTVSASGHSQALTLSAPANQPTTSITISALAASQPSTNQLANLTAIPSHCTRSQQTRQSAPLFTLDDEILFKIFNKLSWQDSVCAGLSSKQLYSIHYELHTPNGPALHNHLLYFTFANKPPMSVLPLYKQIRGFMGGEYRFCNKHLKFVHRSQWEEKGEKRTSYNQISPACLF
jgi:hypothetical protein